MAMVLGGLGLICRVYGGFLGGFRLLRLDTRRVHISTGRPYRAGLKAGGVDPQGALNLGLSGVQSKEISGSLLGPASAALAPTL